MLPLRETDYSVLPDEELMRRTQEGDEYAYKALMKRRWPEVYRRCYGILQNEADAEDVAQETFIKAWIYRYTYDPQKGTVRNWLYKIAARLCLNRLGWIEAHPEVGIDEQEDEGHAFDETHPIQQTNPEEKTALNEMGNDFWLCWEGLDSIMKIVLILHFVMRLKTNQVAKCLGVAWHTADDYVREARRQLSTCMNAKGHDTFAE